MRLIITLVAGLVLAGAAFLPQPAEARERATFCLYKDGNYWPCHIECFWIGWGCYYVFDFPWAPVGVWVR